MIRILLILTLLVTFFTYPIVYAADDITLRAQKTHTVPGKYQLRVEYSGSNPIYIGYAPKGLVSSSDGWFIRKLTWSGSTVTLIQTSVGIWDNRASLTYS